MNSKPGFLVTATGRGRAAAEGRTSWAAAGHDLKDLQRDKHLGLIAPAAGWNEFDAVFKGSAFFDHLLNEHGHFGTPAESLPLSTATSLLNGRGRAAAPMDTSPWTASGMSLL